MLAQYEIERYLYEAYGKFWDKREHNTSFFTEKQINIIAENSAKHILKKYCKNRKLCS